MKKQTDDLVKRAKRHESEAFTELMQLYMTDMYKVAYAILMNDEDAADAIGDTILICWEKMNQLVKIRYFKTWMTRILINKCYDIRKKNQNLICLDEYEEPAACDEYNLELKEALAALDEKYRIIMILFYSEGYRIREISDILKIPESTVKTRLQRGRESWKFIIRKNEVRFMSKKVSEILNSDIQVPEIVQKKADVAFSQIQSERETNMGKKNLKVTKLFAAMAACASIIIVSSTTNNYLNRPQEEKETTVAEHTTTEKENMFTMKVMAAQAEVTAQKPVAIAQNDRFGYAINGDSDMNTASYKIDMPLYCEGENIESVTYSINKGYFEISENITDDFQSAVESGKPLDENSNGYLNPIFDDNGEIVMQQEINDFVEYTVSYENQQKEGVWVTFCNDEIPFSDFDSIVEQKKKTQEEVAAAYQKLVDGVVITCTANYKDGTKKGVKINVGAAALTYEEIGMNVDGMTLQVEGEDKVELQPTDKRAVFTFELQP